MFSKTSSVWEVERIRCDHCILTVFPVWCKKKSKFVGSYVHSPGHHPSTLVGMKQSADRNASKLSDSAHVLRCWKQVDHKEDEAAQPDKQVYEHKKQQGSD